ncbi:hypothetical protein B6R23_18645 [Escherichia coli]|nr:hypothetical protein [Escherichia coli]EFO2627426.1 hypothetical protein [Escherichia coli]
MGKIEGKIFFTSKKYHSNQSPAASSRCLQGTPSIIPLAITQLQSVSYLKILSIVNQYFDM